MQVTKRNCFLKFKFEFKKLPLRYYEMQPLLHITIQQHIFVERLVPTCCYHNTRLINYDVLLL